MRKALFIFLVMIMGMPFGAGATILTFDNFTVGYVTDGFIGGNTLQECYQEALQYQFYLRSFPGYPLGTIPFNYVEPLYTQGAPSLHFDENVYAMGFGYPYQVEGPGYFQIWIDPSNPTGGFVFTSSGHTYGEAFAGTFPTPPPDLFFTFSAIMHFPNRISGDGITFYTGADSVPDPAHPLPFVFVRPNSSYATTLMLGDTLSFNYYWDMGIAPPPYQQGDMFDVLALQGGNNFEFIGQIDAFDGSTGWPWQTATLNVPQDLQGKNSEIRFVLNDYYPETDPTVYLQIIQTEPPPIPEPSTMLLLGSGLLGLVGLRRKFRK